MQSFRIYTLVDITRTQVFKDWVDPLKKRQQDNFNTVHQTLEMRGNVYFDQDPQEDLLDWQGRREKIWIWDIYIEQDDLFRQGDDVCGLAKQDIDFVPFNVECTETVKFDQCFFSTNGKNRNIIIEYVDK